MERWVTRPKRVTSPTWGPPPPCKQALNLLRFSRPRCRRRRRRRCLSSLISSHHQPRMICNVQIRTETRLSIPLKTL